jgi:hypothetical protein
MIFLKKNAESGFLMPATIQERFLRSLNHIDSAFLKVNSNAGRGQIFDFPDVYKLSEGLFLSAWTYWEGFLRDLLWMDLSSDPNGALRSEVKKFRTNKASHRLAELIINHPDHPDKFVEWSDYGNVRSRANDLLGTPHRFINLPQNEDIVKLKRIRNAIAHRSDRAWISFISLVDNEPFNFTPRQKRGITPGRFLYAHQWNGTTVMQNSVIILRTAAGVLVPPPPATAAIPAAPAAITGS